MIDETWLTVENNEETCVCVLLYLYEHLFAGEFAFFPTEILPFAFVDQFWERWKILGTAWTERLAWWLASEVLRSTAAHCSWFTAAWAQPAITSTTYHEAYNVYHTTPCTSNQTQVHKIYPLLINHPDLLCPRWPQPSMMCQRTSHTLPLLGSSTPLCRSGTLTKTCYAKMDCTSYMAWSETNQSYAHIWTQSPKRSQE